MISCQKQWSQSKQLPVSAGLYTSCSTFPMFCILHCVSFQPLSILYCLYCLPAYLSVYRYKSVSVYLHILRICICFSVCLSSPCSYDCLSFHLCVRLSVNDLDIPGSLHVRMFVCLQCLTLYINISRMSFCLSVDVDVCVNVCLFNTSCFWLSMFVSIWRYFSISV